jgi:hypothetical protein
MKTVNEYLELVERTLPDLKASDRLYVVGLLQDAWNEGFDEAREAAGLRSIDDIVDEATEDARQARIEEEEHYADYSDQEPEYDKA